jgi:hypothetical protein
MQLIKVWWITFKETLNMSTNPLPNHALGSGSVNALEVECPRKLKAPMVRVGCEEGNIIEGLRFKMVYMKNEVLP